MISYFIKSLVLLLFSGLTIYTYYYKFPFHTENTHFSNVIICYLIVVIFIFFLFNLIKLFGNKCWSIKKGKKINCNLNHSLTTKIDKQKSITIHNFTILLFTLLNLLFLCIAYYSIKLGFNFQTIISSSFLFFKIFLLLLFPITIFTTCYGFGNFVLSKIKKFKDEEKTFQILTSLGFGFFSFVSIIYTFAFLGIYKIWTVLPLILIFLILGCKSIFKLFKNFFTGKTVFENKLNLFTSEFLFFIITTIISENLIMVYRPFPIGWDEVWVYMNIPHIIAETGKIVSTGQLHAWELYTGIGFLLNSPTLAFILNSFTGIICAIVLYLIIDNFFGKKNNSINFGLIAVSLLLSMPMCIYQFSIDMKLDFGLFFVSIIGLYIIYYIFVKKEKFEKSDFIYIFIAGIIIGFSFAIKLTGILTLSAILGLIIFMRLGLSGFLGYLALYFAFFTKFRLWTHLNIAYPAGNAIFINTFSLICLIIGLIFIAIIFLKYKKNIIFKTVNIVLIFILGFVLALTPWLVKNISEAKNLGILEISRGENLGHNPNYRAIYGDEKMKEIKARINNRTFMNSNGQSTDTDLGRYFGYEYGINNYLKLPYNITMQVNQKGNFTDIGYIFFALLPALLLFIPTRKKIMQTGIYAILTFEILYYFFSPTSQKISEYFSEINLPKGYGIIFLFYILFFIYFIFATNRKKDNILKLLIANLAFSCFYIFLWNISAFGVPWYGIVMYFNLILLIVIGIYFISKIKNNYVKYLNLFIVFFVIIFYLLKSTIPLIFANFENDSFVDYKLGKLNKIETIFEYNPDYLSTLFELNIADDKKEKFLEKYKNQTVNYLQNVKLSEKDKNIIISKISDYNDITVLEMALYKLGMTDYFHKFEDFEQIQKDLRKIRTNMLQEIIIPEKNSRKNDPIFMVGTYLKYFIVNNDTRVFIDHIAINFNDYIYDFKSDNVENTVENFKKAGFSYVLIDFGAPSIDNDPNHSLTKRFEKLLETISSENVEFIDTDNYCLKTGLESYKKSKKTKNDLKDFVILASVNNASFGELNSYFIDKYYGKYPWLFKDRNLNKTEIDQKYMACYLTISNLFDSGLVPTKNNYNFLSGIYSEYKNKNFKSIDEKMHFFDNLHITGTRVLIKIK